LITIMFNANISHPPRIIPRIPLVPTRRRPIDDVQVRGVVNQREIQWIDVEYEETDETLHDP